jgi:hypothetical protein
VKHRAESGLGRTMSMFGRKEGAEEKVQPLSSTPPYHVPVLTVEVSYSIVFVVPCSRHRYNWAQPGLMWYDGGMIGCFEERTKHRIALL